MLQEDEPALIGDDLTENDVQMVAWFSDEEDDGDQW
jgi:hypothetical protein